MPEHPSTDELARYWQSDERMDGDTTLERHVSGCAQCAQKLGDFRHPFETLELQLRSAFTQSDDDLLVPDRPSDSQSASDSVFSPAAQTMHGLGLDAADESQMGLPDDSSQRPIETFFPKDRSAHDSRADRDSRWKLVRMIGRGGIGEVWMVEDRWLETHVALKRLRPSFANHESVIRRFIREARITARLTHPGVPQVMDLRESGGSSFYVMSLVEGHSMVDAIVEFHRQRRVKKIRQIDGLIPLLNNFVSVAQTVAYAHAHGIIHRDIKSDNVILGEFGQVTLIDWGLAKPINEAEIEPECVADLQDAENQPIKNRVDLVTRQGSRLGTPGFMSPEQAEGRIDRVDQRSDIHCLGALLFEILSGHPPYAGPTPQAMVRASVEGRIRSLKELNPDVPPELEMYSIEAMRRSPERRTQTARELAVAVERWVTTESKRQVIERSRAQFFELTRDLMAVCDASGEIRLANGAWEKTLFWPAEAIAGRRFDSFVYHEDRDLLADALARAGNGESVDHIEARMRDAAEQLRWTSWTISPVPDEPALLCFVGRDIDDRKTRERRYFGLLDAAPDPLVVVSEALTIQLINQQFGRLLGYSFDEVRGRSLLELFPERFRESQQKWTQQYLLNPTFRSLEDAESLTILRRDGREIDVDIHLSPLRTEDGLLISASLRVKADADDSSVTDA